MVWWCSTASLAAWLLISGAASSPVQSGIETVDVAKPDGSLQCQEGSGILSSKMQNSLTDKRIEVFSSRRSHDCLMRAQVCGQPTGALNVYQIKKNDLDSAKALGFSPLTNFCE